jgi:hypothetical protein
VIRYDIDALLARFDVRDEGTTALTGRLSSLLGESLLLSALVRYLSAVEGRGVEVLGDRPHRDDSEFPDDREGVPRDLDAWLLLEGTDLAAVECKHWTSSSPNYRSVPADGPGLEAHAQAEWEWLVCSNFSPQVTVWNKDNKVALPLKPPSSLPAASTADARRILAVWTPVSEDGRSCMSGVTTTTVRRGELVPVDVEVFSASMYLRDLRAGGVMHLESDDAETEGVLAALRAVVEVTGFSSAG